MCQCNNVGFGSYANTVLVSVPSHIYPLMNCLGEIKRVQKITIDRCILPEIQGLWEKGIHTIGSCCGHNKSYGYIQVIEEDIPRMEKLGYKHDIEFDKIQSTNNSFCSKNIKETTMKEKEDIKRCASCSKFQTKDCKNIVIGSDPACFGHKKSHWIGKLTP
ncbi:hypothetical protein EZS27_009370 [termite gut metagenome]|uniref:Uncharacterized protein n=1 Tax=termite gut metagenome TaxID=433724 RepID=A0A5J4SC44_9ZZZZ